MSLGSRSRRSGWIWAVGAVAGLAGCHAMPVGRLTTAPNRPQSTLASAGRATLLPATVAMDPPSELSSIEPVATSPSTLTPAPSDRDGDRDRDPIIKPAAPTPLLDAALLRARGLDEASTVRERPVEASTTAGAASTPLPSAPAPPKVEAPVPVAPPPEPEPPRPDDLWRDGVRQLLGLARSRLEQPSATESTSSTSWALRSRVLGWLAEPEQAPGLDHHESDGVRTVLRALDDNPAMATRRGDNVRSAVLALEEVAPLEITELRFCSKVDGFGDFEVFEPPVCKAGQAVILYCEIDGIRFEQTSGGFRTRIATQIEILPEGGGPPIHSRTLSTAEETSRRRRRDYFIGYKIALPRPLVPGDYRIRLTARDLTSDRMATREVAFAISKD